MFGVDKVFIFIPVENGTNHCESFSQAHFPAAVAQQLSSNGSILAQPSPYKNHPSYPTSIILSPAKNKQLYQKSEATVTSVPSSMSPLVSVASSLSHSSVTVSGSVSQPSLSHVPASAAPPPMDVTLQPRPHNTQCFPSKGISNSTLKHCNTTTEAQVTPRSNSDNLQDTGNKPGHDTMPKDPSSALIEQHNVRVVPAVLSFGSLSSFSLSTSSASQHSIPQSGVPVNTSTSITGTPSLFKPSDTYNSPSIGHLGSTVSWLHPSRSLYMDTHNNTASQWTGSRTVQPDIKVPADIMYNYIRNIVSSCSCDYLAVLTSIV